MVDISDVFNIPDFCLSFVNDDNSLSNLQAMVTNVSIPYLERSFDTDARAGLPGLIPLPLGWNNQELTFTLQSFSQEIIKKIAGKINSLIKMQLNGCGLRHTDQTVLNVVFKGNGFLAQSLGMDLQAQSSATSEYRIMLNKYELVISDGTNTTTVIYDPMNYVLSVDGVNTLEDQGQAIGVIPTPSPTP